jgi:uncharacterized membrane protein YgcG
LRVGAVGMLPMCIGRERMLLVVVVVVLLVDIRIALLRLRLRLRVCLCCLTRVRRQLCRRQRFGTLGGCRRRAWSQSDAGRVAQAGIESRIHDRGRSASSVAPGKGNSGQCGARGYWRRSRVGGDDERPLCVRRTDPAVRLIK